MKKVINPTNPQDTACLESTQAYDISDHWQETLLGAVCGYCLEDVLYSEEEQLREICEECYLNLADLDGVK